MRISSGNKLRRIWVLGSDGEAPIGRNKFEQLTKLSMSRGHVTCQISVDSNVTSRHTRVKLWTSAILFFTSWQNAWSATKKFQRAKFEKNGLWRQNTEVEEVNSSLMKNSIIRLVSSTSWRSNQSRGFYRSVLFSYSSGDFEWSPLQNTKERRLHIHNSSKCRKMWDINQTIDFVISAVWQSKLFTAQVFNSETLENSRIV